MRRVVHRFWSLFQRLRFYFLLFCGVHSRVNQIQRFFVLFLWNRRSKQGVGVQRNSSTLSCSSCGHKTRNPWTWTHFDPVWYVSYYSQTAFADEPWLRRFLGECFAVRPSNKFVNDVNRDVDKILLADTLVSLEQSELPFSMSDVWRYRLRSRIGFKDRTSPSTTMAGINHRRL